MPTKAKIDKIKRIQKDIKEVRGSLKASNKKLEKLTERLQELEIYSSSSEEELPEISVGDRVESLTKPNKGRTGTVKEKKPYWITVKADWNVVSPNGKTSKEFTKARHNLKKL